jgi:AraC family transcriptional activator of pobA
MRSVRRNIPAFSLYGERSGRADPADVHIEDIPARSSKYLGQIGAHRHFELSQCIFVTSGPVCATLEESALTFAGPAALIIPAGAVHSFRFSAETCGYVLSVSLPQLLQNACAAHQERLDALFAVPRAVDLKSSPELAGRAAELLACLLREYRRPGRLAQPVACWLAWSVLWTLADGWAVDSKPGMHRHASLHGGADMHGRAHMRVSASTHSSAELTLLRAFRSLIESHYARHWPVERYARELGLSETGLNRLCRRLTDTTAFETIQQRLALEARRRLLHDTGPVAGIAAELGFRDCAYFARFFKRRLGVSPAEFRRGGGKVPNRVGIVQ